MASAECEAITGGPGAEPQVRGHSPPEAESIVFHKCKYANFCTAQICFLGDRL